MVQALVITPVLPERVFADIVGRSGIETCDVVATADPLKDLAKQIRDGADLYGDSIGSQLLHAANLSLSAHQPDRVVFVLPDAYLEGAVENMSVFARWARSMGYDQPISHTVVEGTWPSLLVIGLTCIDWRLSPVLSSVEADRTGWLRLPGVEGALASETRRENILAELNRVTEGGVLTQRVSVRVDPHQDCAARRLRHWQEGEDDAAWYGRDLEIMRADHRACQRFLQIANVVRVNPTAEPRRAFGKSGNDSFRLRTYEATVRQPLR